MQSKTLSPMRDFSIKNRLISLTFQARCHLRGPCRIKPWQENGQICPSGSASGDNGQWYNSSLVGLRRITLLRGGSRRGAQGARAPSKPMASRSGRVGRNTTRPKFGLVIFFTAPLRRSPNHLVGWGRGKPLPRPFHLDAFGDSSPMCPSQNNFLDPPLTLLKSSLQAAGAALTITTTNTTTTTTTTTKSLHLQHVYRSSSSNFGGAEIASTGKCKYRKVKYKVAKCVRVENTSSTENSSTSEHGRKMQVRKNWVWNNSIVTFSLVTN